MTCVCTANADASTGSTWTCVQSQVCPATQPAYSLASTCPGFAFCSYDATLCGCVAPGSPWVCGLGPFFQYYMEDMPTPDG